MKRNTLALLALLSLVCAAFAGACGGATEGDPALGGESHFLRSCTQTCGDALDCISGVCTRGCIVGADSCNELSRGATCTDASIEPGAVAVCDVACNVDANCNFLGTGYHCESGFCRGVEISQLPICDHIEGGYETARTSLARLCAEFTCYDSAEQAIASLCSGNSVAMTTVIRGCGRVAVSSSVYSGSETYVFDAPSGQLVGSSLRGDTLWGPCQTFGYTAGIELGCNRAVACNPCSGRDSPGCE